MRSRRTITLTTASLLTLSLAAALPAAAPAGSLLSGYGGPGQGSQEIIGASVVNGGSRGGGPSGGGSSGSSGGAAGAVGSATAAAAGGATGTSPAAAAPVGSRPGKRAARVTRRAQPIKGQLGSVAAGGTKTLAPAAAVQAVPGGSSALGLSSASLLYMALALLALILTGLFMRLLVRPVQRAGTGS